MEVNDTLYSGEDEVNEIPTNKKMLETQKKQCNEDKFKVNKDKTKMNKDKIKVNKDKIKIRKRTYKEYKIKAREFEKQVKIMEKQKIREEREALRRSKKMQKARLVRERKLIKEKEKMERRKLKNREKMIKNRMKSLRRKLKVKCEAICYEMEDSEEELSESCSEDRKYKIRHTSRSSKHGDNERNKKIAPSKSDEDVSRVLNALLDTDICFDNQIIVKVKKLLKTDSKLQEFFDEYGRNYNNLTNQLKYKLFNRIGPDSKLKFLTSKNKTMSREHRDLVRSILNQVNKEHKSNEQEDSTLEKICKILWRRSSVGNILSQKETQSCPIDKAQDIQRPNKDHKDIKETKRTVKEDNKIHPKNRYEIVSRAETCRGTNTQKNDCKTKVDYRKKTATASSRGRRLSPRSTIFIELASKEIKPNYHQHRKKLSKSRSSKQKINKSHRTKGTSCYSMHESKRIQMTKSPPALEPYTDDSDVKVEPTTTKEVAKAKPPTATFNLWRYFKSTASKTDRVDERGEMRGRNERGHGRHKDIRKKLEGKVVERLEIRQESKRDDRNNDKREKLESRCDICAKKRETDTSDSESDNTSNMSYYESYCDRTTTTTHNDSCDDSEEEKPTRLGDMFWNLLSKRDRGTRRPVFRTRIQPEISGSDRKRKTVWTNK